jgi:deferrochelatase/peroxidase EfeB
MGPPEQPAAAARGLTRRHLLAAGGGALGLAAAAGAGYAVGDASGAQMGAAARELETIPFEGARQAGIATPAQARLVFGSFDFLGADARELLRSWSDAARLMTEGQPVGTPGAGRWRPPEGEMSGAAPCYTARRDAHDPPPPHDH